MLPVRSAIVSAGLLLSGPALAKSIALKKSNSTAKSEHVDDSGVDYGAGNVSDGKASTVWVEGEDGSGLGSWVEIDLGGEQTVTQLKIWNGNWYTHDFWERHNRVKDMKIEFSDGSTQDVTLKDEFLPEVVKLDAPKTTSKVRLYIKGIYRGSTFNDSCISEVQVMNSLPETAHKVASYESSSNYPADNDGSYEPINLADGLTDTLWCEADEGDGTGQWVSLDFGSSKPVSKMRVANGNGVSFGMFMKSNSATKAKLHFSDGSSTVVDLRSSFLPQNVSFPSKTTSSIKVEFVEVKKGKEFNDLCVSELSFSD